MTRILGLLFAFVPLGAGAAEWRDVSYHFSSGEESRVMGPGEACESERPERGAWTASFGAGNHFANLAGERIRVYSASQVGFHDYNTASGHAGMSGHIVFKICLSEPITEAEWRIGPHGKNVVKPARLVARHSRDGETWIDAHAYPAGQSGEYAPPPVTLRFDPPTNVFYAGWFAEVPEGTSWWLIGSTGEFTFEAARASSTTPEPDTKIAKSDPSDLQGPRVVPSTFFGTTTHVNSEGLIRLLQDLKINNVRIDVPWVGVEPSRGQYNFDPNLWMHASANAGLCHGLDQLVVFTKAPSWSLGERGTYPNEESVAALEECMFQLASRYKGRIRHWQAGNEPNMAVWQDRFVPFLKAYYRGVKRADPENKVVLCGFAGVEHLHLDAVYRTGGKDYFDILGAHPYTRPAMPEDGGYLERLQAIHSVMKKHGDQKPLWVDEIGWNGVEPSMLDYLRTKSDAHRDYAVTEEDQARGLARVFLLSATVPWIERVYFFHLHQEAAYTEVADNADYYMGLFSPWIDEQVRPKDAYFAVKTVVQVLSESSYCGRVETPPRVRCLHFERGNEAILALWHLDDAETMTLEDVSMLKSVTSMVGTPVLAGSDMAVSGRPLYLKCASEDAERLAKQIREARWHEDRR